MRSTGNAFVFGSCLARPLQKAGKAAVMVSALLTQWSPQGGGISAGFGRKSWIWQSPTTTVPRLMLFQGIASLGLEFESVAGIAADADPGRAPKCCCPRLGRP